MTRSERVAWLLSAAGVLYLAWQIVPKLIWGIK